MPRIRVMFVVGSLAAGGSERQVLETLKVLDRNRFEPFLYSVYREGEFLSEVPVDIPLFSYWDRHDYPRINFPGLIRRRQRQDLAAHLESQQIDIIYDRNFELTLLAAAACHWRPTHRISVVSSDPQHDVTENAGRFGGLKRWYLKRAYREADRVVAVSRGVAEAVREYYGLPPEKVVTIFSSVDPQRLTRLATEFQPPFEAGRFHIVAVGRLGPPKGYRYLLHAMNELVHGRGMNQLMLWIVGDGPLRGELESLSRERKIDQHVRFTGYQANPIPYMKYAQLFCLPSLYEGMPNSLLEAIVCGTPVLASDCRSGPAEILDGGKYGRLVPPADCEALAEAIADAVANYPRWQSITAAARSSVENRYTLRSQVAALEELLTTVAAG